MLTMIVFVLDSSEYYALCYIFSGFSAVLFLPSVGGVLAKENTDLLRTWITGLDG